MGWTEMKTKKTKHTQSISVTFEALKWPKSHEEIRDIDA